MPTVPYLRYSSTSCAAVSSVSLPSGTLFSRWYRSCMTATASLIYGITVKTHKTLWLNPSLLSPTLPWLEWQIILSTIIWDVSADFLWWFNYTVGFFLCTNSYFLYYTTLVRKAFWEFSSFSLIGVCICKSSVWKGIMKANNHQSWKVMRCLTIYGSIQNGDARPSGRAKDGQLKLVQCQNVHPTNYCFQMVFTKYTSKCTNMRLN